VNPEMLDLIDVTDPVVGQVQVLQGGFPLQALYASDEVVVQVESLKGFGICWKALDLFNFVEGQDKGVQIDEFV
jgi:hypothetical protein